MPCVLKDDVEHAEDAACNTKAAAANLYVTATGTPPSSPDDSPLRSPASSSSLTSPTSQDSCQWHECSEDWEAEVTPVDDSAQDLAQKEAMPADLAQIISKYIKVHTMSCGTTGWRRNIYTFVLRRQQRLPCLTASSTDSLAVCLLYVILASLPDTAVCCCAIFCFVQGQPMGCKPTLALYQYMKRTSTDLQQLQQLLRPVLESEDVALDIPTPTPVMTPLARTQALLRSANLLVDDVNSGSVPDAQPDSSSSSSSACVASVARLLENVSLVEDTLHGMQAEEGYQQVATGPLEMWYKHDLVTRSQVIKTITILEEPVAVSTTDCLQEHGQADVQPMTPGSKSIACVPPNGTRICVVWQSSAVLHTAGDGGRSNTSSCWYCRVYISMHLLCGQGSLARDKLCRVMNIVRLQGQGSIMSMTPFVSCNNSRVSCMCLVCSALFLASACIRMCCVLPVRWTW
jgi:hypothetical protein